MDEKKAMKNDSKFWNSLKMGKSSSKLPDGGAERSPLFKKFKDGGEVKSSEDKSCVKKKSGGKVERIDIEIKRPGALHKALGIEKDKKIPMKELKEAKTKAKKTGDKKLMKQTVFAENFRGKHK